MALEAESNINQTPEGVLYLPGIEELGFGIDDGQVIEAVKAGQKPAGHVYGLTQAEIRSMQNAKFDVSADPHSLWGRKHRGYTIARRELAGPIIEAADLSGILSIPVVGERVMAVGNLVSQMRISQALNFVREIRMEGLHETPDSAAVHVLQGVMFGYPTCDIEYFVKSRYGLIPKNLQEKIGGIGPYILCPPCSAKEDGQS